VQSRHGVPGPNAKWLCRMGRNWRWRKYRSVEYFLKLDAERVTAAR
jgi:hypothetical protein